MQSHHTRIYSFANVRNDLAIRSENYSKREKITICYVRANITETLNSNQDKSKTPITEYCLDGDKLIIHPV